MTAMLHALSARDHLGWARPLISAPGPAGVWSLVGGAVTARETAEGGTAVVLVPSEQVAMTIVDLPLPTRRRRIEALPFAIEDMIADRIEDVHVALGAELAPRRYLAGAIRHQVIADWVAQAAVAGLERAALVPDALMLPVPAEGGWSVDHTDGRLLVRTADGAGFAVPAARFGIAWRAAGRPHCVAYGEALPDGIASIVPDVTPMPLIQRLARPALDLRQGAYAPRRRATSAMWQQLGIVATAGLAAHAAIAAVDLVALQRIAAQREAETRAIVRQASPTAADSDDLVTMATDLLPSGQGKAARVTPLLARVSSALAPVASRITVRSFAYDATAGTLVVDLAAVDLATIQAAEVALRSAGLNPASGGAAAADGGAQGQITVRDPAGPVTS